LIVGGPDVGHAAGADPAEEAVAPSDHGVDREPGHPPAASTASITWVAIGPATSLRSSPGKRSTVAATATFGSLAARSR